MFGPGDVEVLWGYSARMRALIDSRVSLCAPAKRQDGCEVTASSDNTLRQPFFFFSFFSLLFHSFLLFFFFFFPSSSSFFCGGGRGWGVGGEITFSFSSSYRSH